MVRQVLVFITPPTQEQGSTVIPTALDLSNLFTHYYVTYLKF
jgi:hypothetical protein